MIATRVYKPAAAVASIEVTVGDLGAAVKDEIVAFATEAANETPARLFGSSVTYYADDDGPIAVVRLHRD